MSFSVMEIYSAHDNAATTNATLYVNPSPPLPSPPSPSDFCVTELSPQGQPASVEDQRLPPLPLPHATATAAKRRKVAVGDGSGDEGDGVGRGGTLTALCVSTEGTSSDTFKLDDWIGAELACDLAKLSHDYQLTKTPSGERITLGGGAQFICIPPSVHVTLYVCVPMCVCLQCRSV